MAKGAYFGTSSKARKIKKIYFGVGSKAKKVKKAYIGVGGVAKLWWIGKTKLELTTDCDSITYGTLDIASARTSNLMIFAGGRGPAGSAGFANGKSKNVYSYNSSLSMTKLEDLIAESENCSGCSFSGRAVFGISDVSVTTSGYKSICTYTNSGTRINFTSRSYIRRNHFAMAGNDNYLFLGGGSEVDGDDFTYVPNVEKYNSSFTKESNIEDVYGSSSYSGRQIGARVGSKVLLTNYPSSKSVFVFNSSGTRDSDVNMQYNHGSNYQQGISFDNKIAIFCGYYTSTASDNWKYADLFNEQLTNSVISLSNNYGHKSFGCSDYHTIFVGGYNANATIVDQLDNELTLSATDEPLPNARCRAGTCGIENVIIIAGGSLGTSGSYETSALGYIEK